ncbi:phage tail assembly chaperone [Caballeronia sp. INDeC2]|uniref:phage tail assembly chaperone n=1 Tax=Caballeronia sp. INDeC2 TaxID=2921747 RepID=UPI0020289EE9|nr:hypothetical protein [Caballeronia sp. INDeC2]
MTEFEINGVQYRSGKLDTFKQLHVSRKIAPLVPRVLPAFAAIAQVKREDGAIIGDALDEARKLGVKDIDLIAKAIEPVTNVMADMSDADVEYLFANCLTVVQRKQGKDWAPIWRNDALMFDDIELPQMTQIAMKVIWDNLGPFIQGLLAKQAANNPAEASVQAQSNGPR